MDHRGGYSGSNIHDISLFDDGHFQMSKPEHKKLPENAQVKITSKSSKNFSYRLILVLSGVAMTLSTHFPPLTVKMYCLGRLRRKLSVFTVSRLQVGQPQNKSEDMHENVWTTGGGTVVATFMIFPFFMMVTSKFPNLDIKSCLKTTKSKSLQNHQRITTELLLPSHSSFKWGCNDTFFL